MCQCLCLHLYACIVFDEKKSVCVNERGKGGGDLGREGQRLKRESSTVYVSGVNLRRTREGAECVCVHPSLIQVQMLGRMKVVKVGCSLPAWSIPYGS